MAQNIEVKARVGDYKRVKALIERDIEGKPITLYQEDTFYKATNGRLKLRVQSEGNGQLISYRRADQNGPKLSEYFISLIPDPDTLKVVLASSLGVRGVVRKKRLVYLVDNLRIHLDEVEGLGAFLELEVVLEDDFSAESGGRLAEDWMHRLLITEADLIEGAYLDLLDIG